ncbi:hypothetical protein SAMN05216490_2162 [Mucilaginibacter mallensis]|uniref:Uncharacterized protein n=1 Tax=Mucilaginibacter mallensis TaxID=652787 RepID=A0A1H1WCW2_MUCMA|nr:hypothetical protein SAMN05216490_2162 [Mucilaginibacter mallensis]
MNLIFKKNLIVLLSYTVIIVGFSFLFNRSSRSIILFVYELIAGFHFMATLILAAVNHFQFNRTKRNAYMASSGVIWALIFLVHFFNIYWGV